MTIRKRLAFVLASVVIMGAAGWIGPGRVTVHLVGDSTMAEKPLIDNPERGWGQLFPMYFDGSVDFVNHARNGRSTKSFIVEGRWATVLSMLHEGDYVLIQFGHNDGKKEDTTRFAAPRPEFKENLRRFVRDTREHRAIPVLLTPVSRRKFDSTGTLVDTHGAYPAVVKEIAAEERVPLIDLQAKSAEFLQRLGDEPSKRLFLWCEPGRYGALPAGKKDNTHFRPEGAFVVAGMVAQGMRDIHLPLTKHVTAGATFESMTMGVSVTLDYYYNNEWRKGADSALHRFHYVWEDTANSGFSLLGKEFGDAGAIIETLPTAPTADRLSKTDIYIIVDPDTPTETAVPHFLQPAESTVIESWVKNGGTLVLLGNDKWNAEFEHLNGLSERFGIRFNEDSHHRVVGTQFEMGACANLPDHPIFRGVRKIYLKEVCSLSIIGQAKAILSESGVVLLAEVHIGKGMVFAVGDPWLYNEYVDHRKLPQGYDNDRAAVNLVRWLASVRSTHVEH